MAVTAAKHLTSVIALGARGAARLAAALLLLQGAACGNGVGNPIRALESNRFDAGTGGADSGRDTYTAGSSPTEVIPATRHCRDAANYPADTSLEDDALLTLITDLRSGVVPCDPSAGPAPAFDVAPELNCSARLHVLDMRDRDFFDQINPDGLSPADRIAATGYAFGVAGELIAHGELANVFSQLTTSGHACALLLDPSFTAVGIGHLGNLWVVDLAGP